MHQRIIILDFGGQYAHLIASRLRREQVLAEIHDPSEVDLAYLRDPLTKGIVLSGGPQSVYEDGSPECDRAIFEMGKPILGICYGHQWLSHALGGQVQPGDSAGKEFGRAELTHDNTCPLFENVPPTSSFWMSHGDEVTRLGEGFQVCAQTKLCANAAVWHPEKNWFGIQFHPEVTHSEYGEQLLKNFLKICAVEGDWTIETFYQEQTEKLKKQIGSKSVVLFVSGGVDSTVAFSLLAKTIGADRVQGLFVDTGLLRKNERSEVETAIRAIGAELTVIDASEKFVSALKDKTDPEEKRSIIGNAFIEVQRDFFAENQLDNNALLAQGTIYPDTIETGGTKNSVTIKTHHNRVPEIQKLIDEGKVIEPLAELYKDEVRHLGAHLGLPHELVWRHPFPGPGLGVRILCQSETIDSLIEQDTKDDCIVLPLKSVGVQGDFRTYRHPAILNPDEFNQNNLDIDLAEKTATEIINHSSDINRCLVLLGKQESGELESVNLCQSDINYHRIQRLQTADHIVTKTLQSLNLYNEVWQFPTVLAPINFNHQGKESIILRPINSVDAMSASVGRLPTEFFKIVTAKILEDTSISAVFLDVTSKPPGTIEWE